MSVSVSNGSQGRGLIDGNGTGIQVAPSRGRHRTIRRITNGGALGLTGDDQGKRLRVETPIDAELRIGHKSHDAGSVGLTGCGLKEKPVLTASIQTIGNVCSLLGIILIGSDQGLAVGIPQPEGST